MSATDEQFAEWVAERGDRVEVRLRTTAHTSDRFVEQAARYLVEAGGKRLRPALAIAAGGFGLATGRLEEDHLIDAAVIVELTHVASLYHDDVMDEAELRRGAPTAHRQWGNSVAIMVGDFLLAQASVIGAKLGEAFMAYQGSTLARLVQGQIQELRGPDDGADPIEHHLNVVAGKTAALFGAAARYGAMFAGLPPTGVEALTQYGEHLGMAFQLADDLLDIVSDESGKRPGTDLREGVPTLVTLLVRQDNRPEDAGLLATLATPVPEADVPAALTALRAHPAVDQARAEVRRWADRAVACLVGFPDSAPTRALHTLCEQAAVRTS